MTDGTRDNDPLDETRENDPSEETRENSFVEGKSGKSDLPEGNLENSFVGRRKEKMKQKYSLPRMEIELLEEDQITNTGDVVVPSGTDPDPLSIDPQESLDPAGAELPY